jgi:hypothetical protein
MIINSFTFIHTTEIPKIYYYRFHHTDIENDFGLEWFDRKAV